MNTHPNHPKPFSEWRAAFLRRFDAELPRNLTSPPVGEVLFRFDQLDTRRAQSEQRTIEATLSTGMRGLRRSLFDGDYLEELDLSPECVRLDRAKAAMPVLWQHDPNVPIGTAENVRVHDGALRARLRFGESARAQEVWRDVQAGTLKSLSIGYFVHVYATSEAKDDDLPIYRAVDWEPAEVSVVSIPFDYHSIMGRSLTRAALPVDDPAELNQLRKQRDLLRRLDTALVSASDDPDKAVKDALEAARDLLMQGRLADTERALDVLDEAIEQRTLETESSSIRALPEHTAPAFTRSNFLSKSTPAMNQQFSLCRAIAAQFDPNAAAAAGYEREVAQEIEHRSGRSAQGVMIPQEALFSRGFDAATEGGDLIATSHLAGNFIEALRPRLVVGQLGATFLRDLVGNVQIPRKTGDSTAGWIAGDGADSVGQSVPTFDKLTMSPTTVGVQCTISRRMLLQSNPSAELLVRDTLSRAIAQAIDVAALVGSGNSNQPLGILNTVGIGSLTYTNGGSPTLQDIIAMEGELASENADFGNLGYVAHSGIAMTLKGQDVGTDTGMRVWSHTGNGQGSMNGYRAVVSNNLTAGHVVFGHWSDLLIGFWSGLDITTDPYTRAAYGDVVITIMQDCDIAVRHAKSFCELKEAAGT